MTDRRVLVIGSSGAGKSTFAAALGQLLGLPVIHLDQEYWLPGWTEPARQAWRAKVGELAAGEAWVMEGNFSGTWDLRAPGADWILWLDLPRRVCLRRVLRRLVSNYGRVRADMAPGCPERLDLAFLRHVWNYPKKQRPRVLPLLEELGCLHKLVVLRSSAEAQRLLQAYAQPV